MAEGGGEENEENPFSFNKFVKGESGGSSNSLNDSADEDQALNVDLLDGSCSNERRDAEEDRRSRENERDANPFSFKRFLQTKPKSQPSTGPTSLKTLDLANDLPDFVQDHYSEAPRSRHGTSGSESPRLRHHGGDSPRTRHRPDVPLPDFALDSVIGDATVPECEPADAPSFVPSASNGVFSLENSVSNIALNFGQSGCRLRTNPPAVAIPGLNLGFHDQGDSDSDSDDGEPRQANPAGGMPDFLPDSAISGAGARPKVLENGFVQVEADVNEDWSQNARIQQLQAENASLRRQLEEARAETERTQQRLNEVMSSHSLQQVKEAEDAAALEQMVQQVESNLQATTQRALKAEATVNKLRQELKQSKCDRVQHETLQREDSNLRDPLRDKTRYAAEQLSTAAQSAEHHLKHLLAGVENLKMVSEVLLSADKLTDVEAETPSSPDELRGAEGGT